MANRHKLWRQAALGVIALVLVALAAAGAGVVKEAGVIPLVAFSLTSIAVALGLAMVAGRIVKCGGMER